MNLADSAADLVGPTRTYADPGGVRRGIVPPLRLPILFMVIASSVLILILAKSKETLDWQAGRNLRP